MTLRRRIRPFLPRVVFHLSKIAEVAVSMHSNYAALLHDRGERGPATSWGVNFMFYAFKICQLKVWSAIGIIALKLKQDYWLE